MNYEAIQKGDAITAIRNDYQRVSKQREIEARLPEAWSKLLQDEDEFSEFLMEAMAGKTESLCGARPTTEQVIDFLKSLERKTESDWIGETTQSGSGNTSYHQQTSSVRQGLVVIMPNREVINHSRASDTFVEVIEKLGIEKVRDLNKKYIIPLISDSKHPKYNQARSGNYYIMTNSNTETKKRLLDEIASDLGVYLDTKIVDKK